MAGFSWSAWMADKNKERQAPFLKTRRGEGQRWKLVVAMSHARPALWARATLSPMNAYTER